VSAPRILLSTAIFGIAMPLLLRFTEGSGAEPISRILTLGVLAIAPLSLLALPSVGDTWDRLRTIASVMLPVCGGAAVVSLWLPAGSAAGWVAPWMSFALLVACMGITRLFVDRGFSRAEEICASAALLYLPVGAGWLVVSRMGLRPMGFSAVIVVLTAVHFHFAAVAGPVFASRVIRALEGGARRVAAVAGLTVVFAIPVVAAGLTVSAELALVGAVLLAGALLTLAGLVVWKVRPRLVSRAARVLLVISAISLLLSMPLAVLYQWGQVTGASMIDLEWMIRLHGFANAHGFATCALLAWVLEDRALRAQSATESTESTDEVSTSGPSDRR